MLPSDPAFRSICQTGGNVAAAETDVLQFSIAKMAENNNICLARWIRDIAGRISGTWIYWLSDVVSLTLTAQITAFTKPQSNAG